MPHFLPLLHTKTFVFYKPWRFSPDCININISNDKLNIFCVLPVKMIFYWFTNGWERFIIIQERRSKYILNMFLILSAQWLSVVLLYLKFSSVTWDNLQLQREDKKWHFIEVESTEKLHPPTAILKSVFLVQNESKALGITGTEIWNLCLRIP